MTAKEALQLTRDSVDSESMKVTFDMIIGQIKSSAKNGLTEVLVKLGKPVDNMESTIIINQLKELEYIVVNMANSDEIVIKWRLADNTL